MLHEFVVLSWELRRDLRHIRHIANVCLVCLDYGTRIFDPVLAICYILITMGWLSLSYLKREV